MDPRTRELGGLALGPSHEKLGVYQMPMREVRLAKQSRAYASGIRQYCQDKRYSAERLTLTVALLQARDVGHSD